MQPMIYWEHKVNINVYIILIMKEMTDLNKTASVLSVVYRHLWTCVLQRCSLFYCAVLHLHAYVVIMLNQVADTVINLFFL